MDTRDSISIAAHVLTIVSYATVVVVLQSSLRKRRYSSTTLAFAFTGGLLLVSGLLLATNVLVHWWPASRLQGVVSAICACASVGLSFGLIRVLPNAVAFRDLDQLTLAAGELRRSQDRFERALAGASSGLWEWCLETNETWFSPRFKELLGYRDDEFRNEFASWDATLHPDDKQQALAALNGDFNDQSECEAEFRLLTKSGSYRWFSFRALMIHHPDGRPYLVSGSIQDIHARKQAEETIRRQEEYLIQKQKMEALGELAGEVAHEFNNALQAINGQIQFALSSTGDHSATKKELDTATLLIKKAARFTHQLLDFGRPHCRDLRPIPVKRVFQRLAKVLRPLLGDAIELHFRCHQKSPFILADPASLQQALMNLCINARDAMPKGGTLRIASRGVELHEDDLVSFPGANPGNYTLITVSDTGCGMTEAQQARIFEPYYTTKASGKGTGLGLAIVYGVVKEHHGLICCDSRPGGGSAFSIWLPSPSQVLTKRQKVKPAALSQRMTDVIASATIAPCNARET